MHGDAGVVDIAGGRPGTAVDHNGPAGADVVEVGERTGGGEGAGSEGIELAGVEGVHAEGATGEVDGAVEGRVVASIPRAAGVEVEGLVRGAGVVGEGAGEV